MRKTVDKTRNHRTLESISKEVVSKILDELFHKGKTDMKDPKINGKESTVYRKNSGLYIQCQYYPDAKHHPTFRSEVILHPSQIYEKEIEYKFGLCAP